MQVTGQWVLLLKGVWNIWKGGGWSEGMVFSFGALRPFRDGATARTKHKALARDSQPAH